MTTQNIQHEREEMVCYDNRIVPKKGFRAFIYDQNGDQKLVQSWEEFESCIQTGTWFSCKNIQKENVKQKNKGG